jgi:hypothetical protein
LSFPLLSLLSAPIIPDMEDLSRPFHSKGGKCPG